MVEFPQPIERLSQSGAFDVHADCESTLSIVQFLLGSRPPSKKMVVERHEAREEVDWPDTGLGSKSG